MFLAVNLGIGVNRSCIYDYATVKWANDMKLHVFATKRKTSANYEHLFHSDVFLIESIVSAIYISYFHG